MSSLFAMISKYKDQLTLLPVTILIFTVLSIILFTLFRRDRLIKYVPALAGILLGIIFLIFGVLNIAQKTGLEWMWRGVAVFVGGCISLATAWLLAIFSSFLSPATPEKMKKEQANKVKKKSARKRSASRAKTSRMKKVSQRDLNFEDDDLEQTKVMKRPSKRHKRQEKRH